MNIILIFLFALTTVDPPLGTVKVGDYYVDKTEILNIHWLEFLQYKSLELDSAKLTLLLPDTANNWFRRAGQRYKPIVLITYEQAIEYCHWRSKVVSENSGRKVTYRLPTPNEWSKIAEITLKNDAKLIENEWEKTNKLVNKNAGKYVLYTSDEFDDRVYHLFDNVSEMTSERNISMGSNNFEHTSLIENLNREVPYSGSNKYLGFRCIAEIN